MNASGAYPWLQEEDAFLTANHGRMTAVQMAVHVGHPVGSVYKRLDQLNLTLEPNWTPEEDEYLRTHADRLRYVSIASVLGRSQIAVERRARRIGVGTAKTRWSRDQEQQLEREYGTRATADIARELGRTVRAVQRKAEQMGLAFPAYLTVEAAELLWDLRDHPDVESFFAQQFGVRATGVHVALARMRESGGPPTNARIPITV